MILFIHRISRSGVPAVLCAALAACQPGTAADPFSVPAQIISDTHTSALLRDLPPPKRPLDIGVYEFPDLTGQHKPNGSLAEFSRAVTQGAESILVDVMTRAGGGTWFNVVERRGLANLLRERQIIQSTRRQYTDQNSQLTPLVFAGVLIEGGIVAYETNVLTGGVGARYLGIGGNAEYQYDRVTVTMRLVSVNTGRIVLSETTTKEIYSTLTQASVFKFVSLNSLLEIESGFTRNAPPQLAVREAIELGVYSLILQGIERGTWEFAEPAERERTLQQFKQRTGVETAAAARPNNTRVAVAPANPARVQQARTAVPPSPAPVTKSPAPAKPATAPIAPPTQPPHSALAAAGSSAVVRDTPSQQNTTSKPNVLANTVAPPARDREQGNLLTDLFRTETKQEMTAQLLGLDQLAETPQKAVAQTNGGPAPIAIADKTDATGARAFKWNRPAEN